MTMFGPDTPFAALVFWGLFWNYGIRICGVLFLIEHMFLSKYSRVDGEET